MTYPVIHRMKPKSVNQIIVNPEIMSVRPIVARKAILMRMIPKTKRMVPKIVPTFMDASPCA
jgi:hypothetical protein